MNSGKSVIVVVIREQNNFLIDLKNKFLYKYRNILICCRLSITVYK